MINIIKTVLTVPVRILLLTAIVSLGSIQEKSRCSFGRREQSDDKVGFDNKNDNTSSQTAFDGRAPPGAMFA